MPAIQTHVWMEELVIAMEYFICVLALLVIQALTVNIVNRFYVYLVNYISLFRPCVTVVITAYFSIACIFCYDLLVENKSQCLFYRLFY
jgi:hypothetical protein